MSSPTLDQGFHKLNEMGQLVLLVNSLKDLSDSDREYLKDLATKKDAEMLKGLHQFVSDSDWSILQSSWMKLIPAEQENSSFIHKKKPSAKVNIPFKPVQRPRVEQITNSLLSLRKTIGLDRKNPKDLVIQLKSSFSSKENLAFEDFSKLVLEIEPTSEPLTNLNKLRAVKALFEILDDNKSKSLSKDEARNSLVLLSGGSIEEKISAFFSIHDTEGDGLVSYDTVVEHLKESISLSLILEPALKRSNLNIDALAIATAENLFGQIDCSSLKLVSESEYLAWINKEEVSEEVKAEKLLKVKARVQKRNKIIEDLKKIHNQLASKENLKEISTLKAATGLGKVPVSNALKLFKSKNTAGYFSRQQFTEILQELVNKYNSGFKTDSNFYSAVCKLFIRFDQDGNGVMDTAELFCGLSLICAGTLGDKVYAACNCFDESQDGLMQFWELAQFFKVVFRMILPEDALVLIDPLVLAQETASNLFGEFKVEKNGSVTAEMIKKWMITCRFKVF